MPPPCHDATRQNTSTKCRQICRKYLRLGLTPKPRRALLSTYQLVIVNYEVFSDERYGFTLLSIVGMGMEKRVEWIATSLPRFSGLEDPEFISSYLFDESSLSISLVNEWQKILRGL